MAAAPVEQNEAFVLQQGIHFAKTDLGRRPPHLLEQLFAPGHPMPPPRPVWDRSPNSFYGWSGYLSDNRISVRGFHLMPLLPSST
jgi:hypothetical protein